MSPVPVIRPAHEHEWPEAFRFIFQATPPSERAGRVVHGINMVRRGELQREGIWVAVEADQVMGAMIGLCVAGASALVWPPQSQTGQRNFAIEDALMAECRAWLRSQGVRVAQSLMEEKDHQAGCPAFAKRLSKGNFSRLYASRFDAPGR